jgi:APA family basic amino acid/polyamine antiporter
MAVGLILLRRRSNIVRGYRIWGYPVIPAIFIISSLAIVANQIVSDPAESVFGLSLVLAGLPVYFLWARKKKRR